MSNLETLENIAIYLGNMLRLSSNSQIVPVKLEGKSVDYLKEKMDELSVNAVQKATYFDEKVQELEDLLDKPIDLTSPMLIQNATGIVSEIQEAVNFIEFAKDSAKVLTKAYRQKQVEDAGFKSYDDVLTQINSIKTQRSDLRNKFLSGWRFKDKIKDLNSEIDLLYNLSRTQSEGVDLPRFHHSENERFKNAQAKIFGGFGDELFSQYIILLEQLNNKTTSQKINPDVFESLADEFISKYFKSKINQDLEAKKKREDIYGLKGVKILENTELVNEALAVLKEGLNQNRYSNWSESVEDEERAKSLNDRIEALPYELKNIIERGLMKSNKTTNEEFTEFGNYLTQMPIDIEKKRILTSFFKAKQHILTEVSLDEQSYVIINRKWTLEKTSKEIESLLSSEKVDYLKELNMEKWDIFRNNFGVQQLYGMKSLDSFNNLLRTEVFSRLLITPEHTDESVKLGYKAIWFKTPNAVVYNILNFWRESGYSGDRPFLSISTNSEDTLGAQYVISLTEAQLKAVEQLKVPGIMDVINNIRQHPDKFKQSQFNEGDKRVDNSIYEKVQEGLGKVCGYYLENGSDQIKYFVIDVAVDLKFMTFSDKPSKQRDNLIKILSECIGLDDHVEANFKKHYTYFLSNLNDSTRKMNVLENYKEDLVVISNYYDNLDNLLAKSLIPDIVREEANSIQTNNNCIYEVARDLPKLIAYLNGFSSKIIQDQLVDTEYGKKIKKRLENIKSQIFNSKNSIEDITTYVTADITVFKDFIDTTDEIIKSSTVGDVLKSEQTRILDDLAYSNDLIGETEYMSEYFKALNDNKTSRKFTGKDVQTKKNLGFLAKTIYNCNESLVVPLIRETIQRDINDEQLSYVKGYLPTFTKFSGFLSACEKEKNNQKGLFDLIYELTAMGKDSLKLISKIDSSELNFGLVQDSIKRLSQSNIRSTSYLVESLVFAENEEEVIEEWSSIIDSFAQGNFDSTDELHRNLEYSRFRTIVDHEKVRKHIKNHFTVTDYLSIFDKTEETPKFLITNQDKFEIDCVAEEAKVLRDYVLSVKQKADDLGKEVFLIPNLSYGYLPVSPIVNELEDQGVNTIIGVKIGSSESHNNKEVVNSRLFKGYRTEIMNEQPIMIVVDGTQHLVARDNQDKAARYPDAYQGYLNQVVAMNDSMGFTEVDYSGAGKTIDDMTKLRQTPEFQRLVGVYKDVMKTDTEEERKPYQFGLWNTAGMELIIRNYHRKIGNVAPITPEEIQGPAMVFCNVGLLDGQISQELKDKHNGLTHIPAYFDDSGKIINFDFGFDNFGVRYLNNLETEIKKSFGSMNGKLSNGDFVSSLISYVQNVQNRLDQAVGYES